MYCISVIVDSSMCKKREKKKKKKKEKKEKKKASSMYYIVSLPIRHVYGRDTLFHLVYIMVRVRM